MLTVLEAYADLGPSKIVIFGQHAIPARVDGPGRLQLLPQAKELGTRRMQTLQSQQYQIVQSLMTQAAMGLVHLRNRRESRRLTFQQ